MASQLSPLIQCPYNNVRVPRKQYTTIIGYDDDIFEMTIEASTNCNWDLLGKST